MARVFAPVFPPRDPRECAPWLNRELRRMSAALIQGQKGLAAVARGEAPDASGSPLVDLTGVFLLAGRFGGQIGAGDKSPGGSLTLTSTANASKGFIYFGTSAPRMAYDETNVRLGIGTDTPQRQLHMRTTTAAPFTYWRMESGGTAVTNCVSNGTTTVTHGSSGFANVLIGMLVSGTLVPVGTTVTGWASAGSITLSNSISAVGSPSTMTFAPQAEFLIDSLGEYQLSLSAALKIVATGGVTPSTASGLRFVSGTDGTAAGNRPMGWVQFGPTNLNGGISGYNAATGNSLRTLFNYVYFGTWGGIGFDLTNNGRVGINIDPYDFSTSAAANQPGSLTVARRASETSGVGTLEIEADLVNTPTLGTEIAFGIRTASTGTRTSKTTGGAGIELAGFRHDGEQIMCAATGGVVGLLSGSNAGLGSGTTTFRFRETANTLDVLRGGKVSSWSDTLPVAQNMYLLLGAVSGGHRAAQIGSSGFGTLTRLSISSAYTFIGNNTIATALAPDTGPSLLYLMNATTGGADAATILVLKTQRATQSADLLKVLNSNDTVIASISATGVFTGNSADVFYEGDAISYDDDSVYYAATNP